MDFAAAKLAAVHAGSSWFAKAANSHTARIVHSCIVRLQARFANGLHAREAVAKTQAFLHDPAGGHLDDDDVATPVLRVGLLHMPSALDRAMAVATSLNVPKVQREAVLKAVGITPRAQDKARILAWSISGAVGLQDAALPLASVAQSGDEGAVLAARFLREEFARIQTMVAGAFAPDGCHCCVLSRHWHCGAR